MNKPAITQVKLTALVKKEFKLDLGPLYVVGVPGYFMRSMGDPTKNDRGINDDAFIVVSDRVFASFNGNTDPSIYRSEIATAVSPQVIWYRPGQHAIGRKTEHPAFRQDSPVIVYRDNLVKPAGFVHKTRGVSLGGGLWTDKDYHSRFWINNHRGGVNGTSSEGCLTVPPAQWSAYYALIMSELKRLGLKRFPMVLISGPIN